jgi:hypothetical protein
MPLVTISPTTASPTAPSVVIPEKVSPLRFSEAMRLGAMATGQARLAMVDEGGRTLGAAVVGLGGDPRVHSHTAALTEALRDVVVPLGRKLCGHWMPEQLPGVVSVVMHLNDEDVWPRHKIADWLESIGL